MGKVKRVEASRLWQQDYVSIPYGKGKEVESEYAVFYQFAYQFPMGKVKSRTLVKTLKSKKVSIPYGKGRDIEWNASW